MIKKILVITLLILGITIFASCTFFSGVMKNGSIEAIGSNIEGSYDKFSGTYYKKIKLDKSDVLKWNTDVNTEDGSLKLLLRDKEKNVIADLEKEDSVKIEEAGYYYLTAIGDKHSGEFDIEWAINEK
ncbi:hypothetical protein [Clostridium mediterraneense]|uniref:hypothetical protein n=1 Tax=Clostridium mediterraneense TaxID=1805472 RepID=UPI000832EF0F|nr:hypothetical protein [Clostridium mediterraneense]